MANGVSIVLIVFNEEKIIARALSSLESPGTPWEILVIDNGSTDGTKAAFNSFHERNPAIPLRWLGHNPNNLGAARALAVNEARFPIIAFLDADCIAPSGWVKRGAEALRSREEDPSVLGLGSGNRPPESADPFNAALALQLSSPLGHLNTPQARVLLEGCEVRHLPTCNVFYFRERLLKAGNFSPEFPRVCEDLELSLRAGEQGYKLIYLPGIEVQHIQIASWAKWAAKMFRYGQGQIAVARRHPAHLWGVKALPLLVAVIAPSWAIGHPHSFLAFLLFYLGVTWLYSAGICLGRRKPRLTAHVFCLFLVTHFFYSAGELWGLFTQIKRGKMNQGKGEQARRSF
jgi:glycosyltransferase involved in cell wall biosynthesis